MTNKPVDTADPFDMSVVISAEGVVPMDDSLKDAFLSALWDGIVCVEGEEGRASLTVEHDPGHTVLRVLWTERCDIEVSDVESEGG